MSDHLSEEQFRRLLAGQLPDSERCAVDGHLTLCPTCRETIDSLKEEAEVDRWRHHLGRPTPSATADEHRQRFLDQLKQNPPPATADSEPEEIGPGDLPGYEVLEKLRRGGMGVVYKARHLSLGRVVAVKLILSGEPADLARFRTEAQTLARLHHPGIVQVFEVGERQGRPYFAMEFVDGGPLDRKLAGTPQPPREAARLAETLARAIHVAHEHGIIHRDLKPSNVLLAADGTPKIADFGLAKRLDGEAGLTWSGAVVGTPSYMAPEQAARRAEERAVTPLIDVYALGVILYELLTGRPPFRGTDAFATLLLVVGQEPVPPRTLQPAVPHDLETICLKCLHKEPSRRYASALELAEDLRRFQGGEPIRARPVGRGERLWRWCRRKPLVASLIAALLLVTLAGLGAGAWAMSAAAREALTELRRRTEAAEAEARTAGERLRVENKRHFLQRADRAGDDLFQQAETFFLAHALQYAQSDEGPDLRLRWMEAAQRSLVPVETSSRRIYSSVLLYGPDGNELVSGDHFSGAIRIWRTGDWGQARVLPGHHRPPIAEPRISGLGTTRGLAFRPGRPDELISVGLDGMIRIWDLRAEDQARESLPVNSPLLALAVEPSSGRRLVTGDGKGSLTWWDADTLEKVHEVPAAHIPLVNTVRFRPDGQQCASTGPDGVVRLWDPDGSPRGELARARPDLRAVGAGVVAAGAVPATGLVAAVGMPAAATAPPGTLFDLAYSPDGRQLAAAAADGHVYVWDVDRGALLHALPAPEGEGPGESPGVYRLAYASPNRLVSGGFDGAVREWDTDTGREVKHGWRHAANVSGTREVAALAIRPGGREIASSGQDYTLRIWDLHSGKSLAQQEGGLLPLAEIPFHNVSAFCAKDHLLIAASFGEAFLRSWDTRTLRERRTYGGLDPFPRMELNSRRVSALAVDPDGSRFVAAEPSGHLAWWKTTDREPYARSSQDTHQPRDPHRLAEIARRHGMPAETVEKIKAGYCSWNTVTAVAWSHDGKRVASTGADRMLKLWDPQTGKLVDQWAEEKPEPPAAGVLAGLPADAAAREEARLIGALVGTKVLPQDVVLFDGADAHLITAGRDSVIRLWRLDKGVGPPSRGGQAGAARQAAPTAHEVKHLRGHVQRVNAVALGSDGQLASGSDDGMVLIWNLRKQIPEQMISLAPLLKADLSGSPFLLDERQREVGAASAAVEHRGVRSLAFSPNGAWLAVALQDGSVSLVDAATGAVLHRGACHERDGMGQTQVTVTFTRDGELLTVGGDGTVRHWDLPAWFAETRVLHPPLFDRPLTRSTDGSGWVVCTEAGFILQWDAAKQRLQMEWNDLKDPARALAGGRSDGRVVLATQHGRVLVLDLKSGKPVAEFKGPGGKRPPQGLLPWLARGGRPDEDPPIAAVAVEPRGTLAASAWKDGSVDVWDLEAPEQGHTIPATGRPVTALAFAPGGSELAVADERGAVRLWDTRAKKWRPFEKEMVGPARPYSLCYSPDGKALVQAGYLTPVAVWDPASGKRLHTLRGHRAVDRGLGPGELGGLGVPVLGVLGAAFSPGGRYGGWLATAGLDGTLRLWDARHDYRLAAVLSTVPLESDRQQPPSSRGLIGSVTFSPDGSQIIAVLLSGEIHVFEMEAIQARRNQPVRDLLEETGRRIGLRLPNDQLVPVPRLHLVREGEPLRKNYQQNYQQNLAAFIGRLQSISDKLFQGRYAEVKKELWPLLEGPGVPKLAEARLRTYLASAHLALKEIDQAEALVREVLEKTPDDSEAQQLQVGIHLRHKRYPEARDLLLQTLRMPGLLPEAKLTTHLSLVDVYTRMGDLPQAEAVAERAVAIPEAELPPAQRSLYPFAPLALGQVCIRQRRLSRARHLIEQVLKRDLIDPLQQEARLLQAEVDVEMGQIDRAETEIAGVLAADRDNPRARHARASLAAVRGKGLEQAEADMKKLLEGEPTNLGYQVTLAWIQARSGRAKKVLSTVEKLFRDDVVGRNPVYLDILGDVFNLAGRPDRAREAWLKALELFPKPADEADHRQRAIRRKIESP
jgi:WD40 repeat protein/tetratricopeptide (TPR) repeat protein